MAIAIEQRAVSPVITEGKAVKKSPSVLKIEEKFQRPAQEVVREVAHIMTIREMREYLGVSNPNLVMKYLGIQGRRRSEAEKAVWEIPDRSNNVLKAIRSPHRITKHRASLQATNLSKSDEERRQMTEPARAMLKLKRQLLGHNLKSKHGKGKVTTIEKIDGKITITVEFLGGLTTKIPPSLIGKTYFLDDSREEKHDKMDESLARIRLARYEHEKELFCPHTS